MQQGNITSINWNANNFFSGYVSDNNIYTYAGEIIGVNLKKYEEVRQALEKCKNRLIELGEIKIPKTPEEMMKEQTALIEKQSELINKLMEKINEPKSDNAIHTTEPTNESSTGDAESVPNSESIDNKDEGGRFSCFKK